MAGATRNIEREYPPAVLLIEDQLQYVRLLQHECSARKWRFKHATNRDETAAAIRADVFDLALVDLCLDADDPQNRDGLSIARELVAVLAPDTRIVFLSRPTLLSASLVLEMFNVAPQSHRRLAEAFVEKLPVKKVIEVCQWVVAEVAKTDFLAKVQVDGSWWDALRDGGMAERLGQRNLVAADRQFMNIVRQLGSREYMPLASIKLDPVGRGRSRTLVVGMRSTYKPTGEEHFTVAKIGGNNTVEMERRNYVQSVPAFVRCGGYPTMTSYAVGRELGGISYSMIGASKGLPPTFSDTFWDMTEEESLQHLNDVFHSILMPTQPPVLRNEALCHDYKERFHSLQHEQWPERIAAVKRSCPILEENGLWRIRCGREERHVQHPSRIMADNFLEPYHEGLVHGDLHTDNIIMSEGRTVLIDFAHTQKHHVFMDYIVMEIAIRNQLMRPLLTIAGRDQADRIKRAWSEVELHCADGAWGDAINRCENVEGIGERLVRLVRLIRWVRENALLHGYREAMRNYFAGLGMTAWSFCVFQDRAEEWKNIRAAILLCGCFSVCTALRDTTDSSLLSIAGEKEDNATLARVFAANRVRFERMAHDRVLALRRLWADRQDRKELLDLCELQCVRVREWSPELADAIDDAVRKNEWQIEGSAGPAGLLLAEVFLKEAEMPGKAGDVLENVSACSLKVFRKSGAVEHCGRIQGKGGNGSRNK